MTSFVGQLSSSFCVLCYSALYLGVIVLLLPTSFFQSLEAESSIPAIQRLHHQHKGDRLARKLKYLLLIDDHNDRVPLSGKLSDCRMLFSEYR